MTDVIVDAVDDEVVDPPVDDEPTDPPATAAPSRRGWVAAAIVISIVVALAALTGWLGFRAYREHRAQEQRELFLQVGRQGALNLTTIDYAEADADIQRILDSATGAFHDDFAARSQPLVEVVTQAQSKTVGAVTAAGLESSTDTSAKVLVAVTVQTWRAGAPQPDPRKWRIRLTIDEVDHDAKVANVEFVP
jgi:Mce-associated membrane protein